MFFQGLQAGLEWSGLEQHSQIETFLLGDMTLLYHFLAGRGQGNVSIGVPYKSHPQGTREGLHG